jgi:type IV pilus assembly protein PilP
VSANRFFISLLVIAAAMATVLAQTPAGRPGGAKPAATTAAATGTSATSATSASTTAATPEQNVQQSLQEILEEPTAPDSYHYDPQGRRDPFQSLIGPAPKLQPGQRPAGVPGFLIDEMKLQGVVKTRQGLVAMINGPDNKGYLIRVGDKVLDGEVIRITPNAVTFRQEVNDPTRIERFREVVKELNPTPQAPVRK